MSNILPDPNKIKLIATDLDGTLLNPKGEISERTRTIIKRVLTKYPNLHFALATSRERSATKHIREALDILDRLNTEAVLLNGSIIYDSIGNILCQKTLSPEFVVKFDEVMALFSDESFLYSCGDEVLLFNKTLEYEARVLYQKNTILVDREEYTKKIENGEIKVNKIIYRVSNTSKIKEIKAKLEELVDEYNLEYANSDDSFFEFMPPHTNKGTGLAQLIQKLNITKEEVMGFGDGSNDIEFFENVGWPVAMQNACEELKSLAKLTTKSNVEDGVADMLERIFLKEELMN
ncbi:hypothetical protein BCR32DRAFT_225594 [Anaeromyces robustus]|uniref:HAD-like protein n=1 Tax=Anaeromyces robustus TaxID=1754192 RepID=A0A1Y1WCE3_9FUNG|nr:hypothetical protein BCR32DRAFT_225594 [Anaeromyces robustus]|eukprot:ORX71045.1 hypothetical protein BCR32DRAFT_225594 [Anaeromyces robustus]